MCTIGLEKVFLYKESTSTFTSRQMPFRRYVIWLLGIDTIHGEIDVVILSPNCYIN